MSLTVSSVLPCLVCLLCVFLVPAESDESCLSFVDTYGVTHDAEKCNKYCCGTCNLRYCCKDKPKQLNQESCSGSLASCDKFQHTSAAAPPRLPGCAFRPAHAHSSTTLLPRKYQSYSPSAAHRGADVPSATSKPGYCSATIFIGPSASTVQPFS
ncbi:uncharacterized protein LOC102082209 isoform X2 [Oreochromis niloticus]|uniref:uncharacterized protein LOC102082209 isoform X2 n=1 Tax=Oreochromis niloticus TaxID=8128 RepID=UPI0009055354|nr:uncharacterized protein LOC102082209 isoform X2 [Oreochromis niloticus]